MPDLPVSAVFSKRHALGNRIEPFAIDAFKLLAREHLPPRADEAVTCRELAPNQGMVWPT